MQVLDYQEAIFASNLSSNAKLAALAIGSYYNWQKKQACWPSNESLAKATGLSISTIIRAKKELISEGYLSSERRYDSTNKYIPMVPQTIPYRQPDHRVLSDRPTNNEVNNEVNNEIKVDSFQSSTFANNNNLNQGGLDNVWEVFERTDRRRQGAAGRNYQINRQDNKRSRANEDINAAVSEFNQTVAEVQGQEW